MESLMPEKMAKIADYIFKCIFLNEIFFISIEISLKLTLYVLNFSEGI